MVKRFTGVFVNPYYAQAEGVGQVLDRLQAMGTTAIVTHPRIARPVAFGQGTRFPDLHGDGHSRLLARPLWGRREMELKTELSYRPNAALYSGTPYSSPVYEPSDDPDRNVPRALLREAKMRGMEAHIFLHPFLPGKLREDDIPRLIDGSFEAENRFSDNACLNSPAAFGYAMALVADTLDNFPEADGLMPDWTEFGVYRLEDTFSCFCRHCEAEAKQRDFDWDLMRRGTKAAWDALHRLTPEIVARYKHSDWADLRGLIETSPGLAELARFKAHTVAKFYEAVRAFLVSRGTPDLVLTARGWPPPWNFASGLDYGRLASVCQVAAPKLFTFDYCALPRWYGETLKRWNPALSEKDILDFLVNLLDLPDAILNRSFTDYTIPPPEVLHQAPVSVYAPRMAEVAKAVHQKGELRPFSHAYLPLPQWREMLVMLRDLPVDGLWIQMYGYLSDEKMHAVREIWSEA